MATTGNIVGNAPPKADAAPTADAKFVLKSLCDALNASEQALVTGPNPSFTIPNVYEIVFDPPRLASSKVTTPGPTDKNAVPTQKNDASALNSATNSVQTQAKNISASQGMPILQFIENTMRNSSYITDQQKASKNVLDPSAPLTLTASNNGSQPTTWFRILVNATPIGNTPDPGRKDFAYRVTYTITTYGINQMDSSYFSDGRFRGVHKNYYYWFTGLNTQVLHYEQSYNNVYVAVAGPIDLGQGIDILQAGDQKNTALGLSVGIGDPTVSRQYAAQTTQQAKNDANTPAATAADFLYSASDQSNVTIRIVGDPAWLLQGEIIGFQKLCFDGFWPNGAVVTETQEAVFAINFNTPADYNNGQSGPSNGTGLMDINAAATKGNSDNLASVPTEASAAYKLKEVTSTFSRGKFEQELSGVLLKNLNQKQINQFRSLKPVPPKKDNPVPAAGTRKPMKFEEGSGGAAFGNPLAARRGQRYKATQSDATGTNSATPAVNLTPSTAKAAGAPTSEGVPVGSAKPAATSPAPISKAAGQRISETQNAYQNATEDLRQARKYYPNKVTEAQQAVNTARNAWKSAVDASQVPDTQPGTNTQTMASKDQ